MHGPQRAVVADAAALADGLGGIAAADDREAARREQAPQVGARRRIRRTGGARRRIRRT